MFERIKGWFTESQPDPKTVWISAQDAQREAEAVEYFRNLNKRTRHPGNKTPEVDKFFSFGVGRLIYDDGFVVTVDDENRVINAKPMQRLRIA